VKTLDPAVNENRRTRIILIYVHFTQF